MPYRECDCGDGRAAGAASYAYGNDGNMTTRGTQTLTWDVENRPVTIVDGGNTTTFVYDGEGKRGKKTEAGETVLYVNKYYEKNLTTGVVTTYYYFGEKPVAQRTGTSLKYIHLDNLGGTSMVSDDPFNQNWNIKYYPYGATRAGNPPNLTKKFTGQRLDGTGLYYYNARYYDPQIGRFISADTFVQAAAASATLSTPLTVSIPTALPHTGYSGQSASSQRPLLGPADPQALNRYTYALGNPLRYLDPGGWWTVGVGFNMNLGVGGGGSFSFMVVWDGHGGKAIVTTASGGGYAGAGGSASVQFQYTTADTVDQLAGWSTAVGGSVGEVPTFGLEWMVGWGGGRTYQGVNANIALGVSPIPLEMHGFLERSWVKVIQPSNPKMPEGTTLNGKSVPKNIVGLLKWSASDYMDLFWSSYAEVSRAWYEQYRTYSPFDTYYANHLSTRPFINNIMHP